MFQNSFQLICFNLTYSLSVDLWQPPLMLLNEARDNGLVTTTADGDGTRVSTDGIEQVIIGTKHQVAAKYFEGIMGKICLDALYQAKKEAEIGSDVMLTANEIVMALVTLQTGVHRMEHCVRLELNGRCCQISKGLEKLFD